MELDFTKIKPTALPTLSLDNLMNRLAYCERHLHDKFSNVVFSDESNFQLAPNKQVLWYRKGVDPKPNLAKPKNNKKVMIWGGISRRGQTQLFIYRLDEGEKSNKESYVDCLESSLIDAMNGRFGDGKWRFLQDNARPHKAEYTMDFLEDANVRVIEHPPYSPDLNPIEKVWAWMKADIGKKTYDTIEDLIKVVVEKWESMTTDYQNSLIDHHIKVVQQVNEAKGHYV